MKSLAWKLMTVALLTAAIVFALDSDAYAGSDVYGGSTADPVESETTRMLSLSISAPHLIVGPVFELQVEFDASDKLSLAALGGWGQTVTETDDTRVKLDVWNAGGQVRYFPKGNFDKNLHLGLEAMYTDVQEGPGDDELGLFVHRRGISVGPFVGGKYITDVGLTAEAQIGIAYEGMVPETQSSSGEGGRIVPIANLNIGWSF